MMLFNPSYPLLILPCRPLPFGNWRHLSQASGIIETRSSTATYSTAASGKAWKYFNMIHFYSKPGTNFSYATYNYTVLSAVIEELTQTGFLRYMQKEVFTPLGMHHTVADEKIKTIVGRAGLYNFYKQDNTFKKATEVNNSNKWAGGGLLSTPSDLVKVGNSLLNNTFLDANTTAMIAQHTG